MVAGLLATVTCDGDEDVTCADDAGSPEYCQVKTVEFPSGPWTVANVCEPERAPDRATSILGRLFVGKPLPESATFRLVGNMPLHPHLRPFVPGSALDRSAVSTTIAGRLGSLALSDGRTVGWCLDRLTIEQVGGDADALEAMVLRELGGMTLRLSIGLLQNELESLLEGLVAVVQQGARSSDAAPIARDSFIDEVRDRANRARGATADAAGPEAPTLAAKLAAAGLSPEQIAAMKHTHLEFSRTYRSALPDQVRRLDNMVERIRMACVQLTLRRREGLLAPGAAMFAATDSAVRDLHAADGWDGQGIPLVLAYGAMHDVTARCQHRYD
jgi:hypothetical protein